MAEVGIERLGAGTGQKHEAHDRQPEHAVVVNEQDAVQRIERLKNVKIVGDMHQSAERQHGEPDAHDGTEKFRDPVRAARLHPKQDRQNDDATTGMTATSNCGAMSFRPSTADSTEIAGVMTASP